MTPLLVSALFTCLAGAALALLLPASRPTGTALRRRLGPIPEHLPGRGAAPAPPAALGRVHAVDRALDGTGLRMKAPAAAGLALAVIAGATCTVGAAAGLPAALLAGGCTTAAVAAGPRYLRSRRRRRFRADLPDALSLLASGLSAGSALAPAVDVVARESTGPVAEELARAVLESQVGLPLDEGLRRAALRMRSTELAWAVEAMAIAREVGGQLSSVLSTVAATAREREGHRRRVRALTAEGRLSALVLSALPPVFAVYLALTRPEYVGALVTEPLGQALAVAAVGMLGIGVAWMHLLVRAGESGAQA